MKDERYARRVRQIVAMGGGGFLMEPENPLLDDFVLGLGGGPRCRVCFLATASGDSDRMLVNFYTDLAPRCRGTHLPLFRRTRADLEALLLAQDVIYVGGGNTANMLAVWRVHGVDRALRRAYDAGVVLAGISAGGLCWFDGGVTDSFGGLDAHGDGLGLLPGTFCPHFDEPDRRPSYERLVGEGLPDGWGADAGAALHFVDGELHDAVCSRPHARVYRVERAGEQAMSTPRPTRYLGATLEAR
jgi:dipeptidase E